eukprot:CAMPEP_0194325132 /NCGR_PEP_ID=MMETSP0171-20130528/29063_1 /TAXON_ID=218684 /ORGANISM="Corethron pennatum, Strain L29A3" /LENGTH=209 /DNA_ID=CAMNT_0039084165 /DNA_START=55 /DNA_END=684 /DNA_ORIENTATION=-
MKSSLLPFMLVPACLANANSAFVSRTNNSHGACLGRALLATPDDRDAVACFGRLGDKMYVIKKDEVTGTAASGYEFGILQAGRPKWIPCYERRSGPTQGGGAELEHEPNWRTIFGEDGVIGGRDAFADAIASLPFSAPLGAPTGILGAEPPSEEAVSVLWNLFGGSDGGLSVVDAVTALRAAAATHNTDMSDDKFTYKSFAAALTGMSE